MYPASRLMRPDPRSGLASKILSLVAAMVLLAAFLEIFYVYKPHPARLVENGLPVAGCSIRMNGPGPGDPVPPGYFRSLCHLVVPNQHVVERIAIGMISGGMVFVLMVAASRVSRRPPILA
jgi:hypothetical protein